MKRTIYFLFALALLMSSSLLWLTSTQANSPEDFTIPNGHFYSQTVDGEEAFMDNSFGVGFWLSEGRDFPPNGALNFLRQQYFTANNHITFPEPQPEIKALLGGFDPQNLVAPETNIAQILFSKGWGSDGQAEALLFITQKADGGYVWETIIIAHYGFDLSGR